MDQAGEEIAAVRRTLTAQQQELATAFPYDLARPDGLPDEVCAPDLAPRLQATLTACERLFGITHHDTRIARAQLG